MENEKKIFYSGCNYWHNKGENPNEPVGTVTAMHTCTACSKLDTCDLKKETEVWCEKNKNL